MAAAAAATAAAGEGARHSGRTRKASRTLPGADADARRSAAAARLDALEADNADAAGEESDEYVLEDEGGAAPPRARKAKGAKRVTRGAVADRRGPKPLAQLLDEARLDLLEASDPSYLRAEMGPPRFEAPRKYCTVCGFAGPYSCARCGMRYCSRCCAATHADTRCLRFTVY
jgi:zinc finger HIT domain-containing protein 1